MTDATQLDYAYAAGYIDGEGHFSITQHYTVASTGMWRIRVETCDYETLLWFNETFGGNLNETSMRKNSKRQPYGWYLSGTFATDFCKQLKLKNKEAQRLIFIKSHALYLQAPKNSQEKALIIMNAKQELITERNKNVICS